MVLQLTKLKDLASLEEIVDLMLNEISPENQLEAIENYNITLTYYRNPIIKYLIKKYFIIIKWLKDILKNVQSGKIITGNILVRNILVRNIPVRNILVRNILELIIEKKRHQKEE